MNTAIVVLSIIYLALFALKAIISIATLISIARNGGKATVNIELFSFVGVALSILCLIFCL